jgi:hypothetical protein
MLNLPKGTAISQHSSVRLLISPHNIFSAMKPPRSKGKALRPKGRIPLKSKGKGSTQSKETELSTNSTEVAIETPAQIPENGLQKSN